MDSNLLMQTLGPMAWPLLLCSFAVLSVVIERVLYACAAVWHRRRSWQSLVELLNANARCEKALRDELLSLRMQELAAGWGRGIGLLRAIATLSPLLGMLGTIIGVMQSFQRISHHQGSVSPALIADGLWQALTTTAAGLAIALCALTVAGIQQGVANSVLQRWQQALNARSLTAAGIDARVRNRLGATA